MKVFTPNSRVPPSASAAIVATWAALIVTLWSLGGAFMIPSPAETVLALGRMVAQEGLLYELFQSARTNLEALAISAGISLVLSYLTVVPAAAPAAAIVAKARFFGLTGFVIMFTMAFGGGHALKVALLVFGMTTFYVTSMAAVVAEIPRSDYDQARSLRMGPWRSVLEVVVIGRLDAALEVTRQNAAMGWVMLTMVEGLVRSEGGVGALILSQGKHFHLDAVFAIVASICLVGAAQDLLLWKMRDVLCPHARLTTEAR